MLTSSIYVNIFFGIRHSLYAYNRWGQLCYLNPDLTDSDCLTVTATIPTKDNAEARREVGTAFAEKAKILQSHEYHQCTVSIALPKLLAALESSRILVLRAFGEA